VFVAGMENMQLKFVLEATPSYIMSISLLPNSIIDDIKQC